MALKLTLRLRQNRGKSDLKAKRLTLPMEIVPNRDVVVEPDHNEPMVMLPRQNLVVEPPRNTTRLVKKFAETSRLRASVVSVIPANGFTRVVKTPPRLTPPMMAKAAAVAAAADALSAPAVKPELVSASRITEAASTLKNVVSSMVMMIRVT